MWNFERKRLSSNGCCCLCLKRERAESIADIAFTQKPNWIVSKNPLGKWITVACLECQQPRVIEWLKTKGYFTLDLKALLKTTFKRLLTAKVADDPFRGNTKTFDRLFFIYWLGNHFSFTSNQFRSLQSHVSIWRQISQSPKMDACWVSCLSMPHYELDSASGLSSYWFKPQCGSCHVMLRQIESWKGGKKPC